MKKPKQDTSKAEAPVEETSPAPEQTPATTSDPLASKAGREWLDRELVIASYEAAHGPGGSGWQFNEGLRPEIVERVEFIRALIAKLS